MAHDLKRILSEAKDYPAKPKRANTLDPYGRIWRSMNQSGLGVVEYVDYVASTTPGQFVSAAVHGLWELIFRRFLHAARKMTEGLKHASADELNEVIGVRMVIDLLRDQNPPKEAFLGLHLGNVVDALGLFFTRCRLQIGN